MTRTTRSAEVELPDSEELDRLKLSPEVAWYLVSRGIPLPDCPPRWKTPEPREEPGARFDPDRVDKVLATFRALRHTKGRLAGRPLIPDSWQVAYILAPAFGWVHLDEDFGIYVRIIRTLYVELPRKNGKSTLAGGIGIYLTAADGEEGAQVIAAATRLDQAQFVFAPIKLLAEKSPALRKHVTPYKAKIVHNRTASYFQPVANAGDAQHGADLHGGIVDELHLHKTNELVEAIETGTGSRTQPLIVFITTADDSRKETPYDRKRGLVEQLARGVLKDATTYGVIWAADENAEGFDPYSEEAQRAANPGFGISPTRAFLRQAAVKAQQSPADDASYRRLHLGIRTKQAVKYLDIEAWDRNASIVDEERLRGRACYGGLDLAATSDLTALAWAFPDADRGGFDVLWRIWIPERGLRELDKRTAGGASVWAKRGYLTVTPGDVADYDFIRSTIVTDSEKFDVREIAYDRWNSTQLVNDLTADGAPMVTMGQGYASMSAPTKELQRLVLLGTEQAPMVRHGGNPAARWTVDNFAVAQDDAGNVKPSKANAGDKIDPVVALIMAIGRATEAPAPKRSAYEDDGLMVV
ncbi:terminase large subunit [Nocardia farcinica]|uniref:Putative phage terminase large subunit n=1 Tax=Nocardia farcinica (strain IFM 10152) TaxID=247156 RepID=Q5Z3W0_NOCFA|nr:terminase TerL endonuclease subunit [Nocardia farcinica]BAD54881.1 putative phage terminase large subunit [Nocardia farcinica IFM 10152]